MNVSADKIWKYAQEHEYFISPYDDIERRVKKMNEKGCCLCDPNRLECPCWQAEIEVVKMGKCKCNMFVCKAFYDWMMKRKIEHEKTGKWSNEIYEHKEG